MYTYLQENNKQQILWFYTVSKKTQPLLWKLGLNLQSVGKLIKIWQTGEIVILLHSITLCQLLEQKDN